MSIRKIKVNNVVHNIELNEVQTKEYYYDDGSGKVVPAKHPDLSTQPSILPYKFMG